VLPPAFENHPRWNDERILPAAFLAAAFLGDIFQRLKPAAALREVPRMHPLGMAAAHAEHPKHAPGFDGIDKEFDFVQPACSHEHNKNKKSRKVEFDRRFSTEFPHVVIPTDTEAFEG
jgi:hypothetical protein